jgi:hypothetical protein
VLALWKRRRAVDDWEQQRQNEEERYHTEPVILTWTQADIDRHNELRRELKQMIEESKKCRNF